MHLPLVGITQRRNALDRMRTRDQHGRRLKYLTDTRGFDHESGETRDNSRSRRPRAAPNPASPGFVEA